MMPRGANTGPRLHRPPNPNLRQPASFTSSVTTSSHVRPVRIPESSGLRCVQSVATLPAHQHAALTENRAVSRETQAEQHAPRPAEDWPRATPPLEAGPTRLWQCRIRHTARSVVSPAVTAALDPLQEAPTSGCEAGTGLVSNGRGGRICESQPHSDVRGCSDAPKPATP